MLQIFNFSIPAVLTILLLCSLINNVESTVHCKAEFKMGHLEIKEDKFTPYKNRISKVVLIPTSCTSLKMLATENETGINWETMSMDHVAWPKLKQFDLYISLDDFTRQKFQFQWKYISLFGYDPEKITQSWIGMNSYLYINKVKVINYDTAMNYLIIQSINPVSILNAFSKVGVKGLTIMDTEFKDIDFLVPKNLTTLTLKNVRIRNFSEFIQKFEYLETLTLIQNNFDITDILQSKSLVNLDIIGANLMYNSTRPVQNDALKSLSLTECFTDTYFNANAWKAMPNLTTLYISTQEEIDFEDIFVYEHIPNVYLRSGNLTLIKTTHV